MMKWIGTIAVLFLACTACAQQKEVQKEEPTKKEPVYTVVKTEEEWKKQLTEEQYYVTRENGTERAFSGELYNHKGEGTYHCVCCDNDLFLSATKFKSGTGWPSFYAPSSEEQVNSIVDSSYGMRRTEVECSTCGAHLGHVFEDGPKPTGLRYCINSASLSFKAKKE